jgi:hypothetical protein
VVVVFPPPPQPTTAIATSKLKLIPRMHAVGRRPSFIDLAPAKPEFRLDSYDIKDSSVELK